MNKNKKIGLALLIGPFLLLAFTLSGYAITNFVYSTHMQEVVTQSVEVQPVRGESGTVGFEELGIQAASKSGLSEATPSDSIFRLARVGFGLLGLVAVFGILIGVPMGIYFLNKKDLTPEVIATLQMNPRYAGLTTEQITYIHSWSWSAFFATFVWALGSKLYVWALMSLVPVLNIYPWMKMSVDGRKTAWESGKWEHFDHFRRRQTVVAWVSLAFFIVIGCLDLAVSYLEAAGY